jgi:hypothetical protein
MAISARASPSTVAATPLERVMYRAVWRHALRLGALPTINPPDWYGGWKLTDRRRPGPCNES